MSVRFSAAHFWVRVEGSEAVLGLSDYLQDQMGEIIKLDLRVGRRMGHLESEEASSPLEAPLSGEVVEVNAEAIENPDLVNSDPYASGWLLRIRLENPEELEDLISEEEYADLTTEV
jgi:glycine cleavage system H protein